MRMPALFLGCALVAAGCGDTDGFGDCTTVLTPAADADQNHDVIQTALGDARPGDRICLRPGTYKLRDELTLTTADVEVRGSLRGGTVLDFAGQLRGANGLNVSADGFRLWSITVKNTAGDAVRIAKSKGVTLREVKVTWDAGRSPANGAYGLYPTESSEVVIDRCQVSYASDAGIYVGQSTRIVVRDSEVERNVAGIEIENSVDADVYGNFAHDNTAGILVLNLPNLPQKNCRRVNVHDNLIRRQQRRVVRRARQHRQRAAARHRPDGARLRRQRDPRQPDRSQRVDRRRRAQLPDHRQLHRRSRLRALSRGQLRARQPALRQRHRSARHRRHAVVGSHAGRRSRRADLVGRCGQGGFDPQLLCSQRRRELPRPRLPERLPTLDDRCRAVHLRGRHAAALAGRLPASDAATRAPFSRSTS